MKVFKMTPKNKLIIAIVIMFSVFLIQSLSAYAAKISTEATSNTSTVTKTTKSTTVVAGQNEVVLGYSKSLKITNISNWTYEQAKDGRLQVTRSGNTLNYKGLKKGTTYIIVKEEGTGNKTKYPIKVLSNVTSLKISRTPSGSLGAGSTVKFTVATSPVNFVGKAECGEIKWSSSDSSIISINSTTGQAEYKKAGKAVITATYSDRVNKSVSAKTTVTVAKPKTNLKVSQKSHEDRIVGFSNEWTITSKNGWKYETPNDGIISVRRNGDKLSYTAIKQGITNITIIEEGTGKTKKTKISVLPYVTGIEITNKKQVFKKGRTYTLRAKTKPKNFAGKTGYGTIKWISNNTSIAEIDPETGRVKIKKDGTFKITVTYSDRKHDKVTDTAEISTNTSSGSSSGYYSTGSTSENERAIFNFLTSNMKLNKAAACGVLANIEAESSFDPNVVGDGGTSFGICQWHDERYSSLKNWCSSNGKDYRTLDGQLWYLKYDLEHNYSSVLNYIKNVSNNANGAYNAGYYWCKNFEVPADTENMSILRGNNAKNSYYPKYN